MRTLEVSDGRRVARRQVVVTVSLCSSQGRGPYRQVVTRQSSDGHKRPLGKFFK